MKTVEMSYAVLRCVGAAVDGTGPGEIGSTRCAAGARCGAGGGFSPLCLNPGGEGNRRLSSGRRRHQPVCRAAFARRQAPLWQLLAVMAPMRRIVLATRATARR